MRPFKQSFWTVSISIKIYFTYMKPIKQLLLAFSLMAISMGSGAQNLITRTLPEFHNISIMGKMRVELYKSDTSRIEFSITDAPAENLITEVKNNILSIRLKTDTNKNSVIRVLVYYSTLTEIAVAANTLLVSNETITADKIKFIARSGAKMELDLNLKNLEADVKQGAILVFSGKTNRQEVSVNTGATYSAYKLQSDDTYVTANSGSKAKVCAARIIDAVSNTKSYIGYIGVPVSIRIKTNIGGEIASFASEEAVFEE